MGITGLCLLASQSIKEMMLEIRAGIKQGKNKDADLMVAGNAIERVHKNIQENRNFMLTAPISPLGLSLSNHPMGGKSEFRMMLEL